VPPDAASKYPARAWWAPVNAPRSWPNSSLSSSVSASEAQCPRAAGPFVRVERARDQLLAGAGLAADEDGRRALRHLGDHGVDLAHGAAVADDVAGAELAAQLLAQPLVLRLQLLALLELRPEARHRVGEDVRHRLEEAEQAAQRLLRAGRMVDAQRPDDLAVLADRHAQEGHVAGVAPRPRPVQEARLLGDVRNQA